MDYRCKTGKNKGSKYNNSWYKNESITKQAAEVLGKKININNISSARVCTYI